MRFHLTIECDNEAFDPDPDFEVARILRAAADRIADHACGAASAGLLLNLRDSNGNTVGACNYGKPRK